MNAIELPRHWRPRAILISESPLPLNWFSEEELRDAEKLRLPRRRQEFLLSRAAAKTLAVELGLSVDHIHCRIDLRRIGTRHLSLSHSEGYAAAAIDAAPVGIDVQKVRPLRENASHLFLTDEETASMQRCAVADRMIHFWCAKEAAWKRRQGTIETLKRVPLQLQEETRSGLTFDGVETFRVGDVVVALTLPTS